MTSKDFFIYGSFCEGYAHFNKIQSLVSSVKDAQILGSCLRTQVGYPLVMDCGEDFIPGHLMKLNLSQVTEAFLDEMHAHNPMDLDRSLTHKKNVSIFSATREVGQATAYFLNPLKKTSAILPIEGGDWRAFLEKNPPLPQKLTDRQRTYVAKLGTCSGRDIVPIDMILYRELMNLELIVDKGRRLALSKLGQEVYRYLG